MKTYFLKIPLPNLRPSPLPEVDNEKFLAKQKARIIKDANNGVIPGWAVNFVNSGITVEEEEK